MAADPEVTLICIDNSKRVFYHHSLYYAQLEAIKFYCKTKFECNSENTVGLFSMSSRRIGPLLSPTRDLQKILDCASVKGVYYSGEVEFSRAATSACLFLSPSPPNMKKRLLMFVGGPINMRLSESKEYVKELKKMGAALDIVNFFLLDIDESSGNDGLHDILYSRYRYARRDLHYLVADINDDDNCHIVDVEDEASVIRFLANSILKESLHYIGKTDAAIEESVEASRAQFVMLEQFPNERRKSAAHYEYVQAPGIKYLTKRTPPVPGKNKHNKPKENYVQKNQAVAKYGKYPLPPWTEENVKSVTKYGKYPLPPWIEDKVKLEDA